MSSTQRTELSGPPDTGDSTPATLSPSARHEALPLTPGVDDAAASSAPAAFVAPVATTGRTDSTSRAAKTHSEPEPRASPLGLPTRSTVLDGRAGLALLVLALLGCLAGLVAGVRSGPLWLDEALSVSIARLPLLGTGADSLYGGLRQDGAPPLYYLLLKAWTGAFGTGTGAVRLLSVVLTAAALLLTYVLGRRAAGTTGGRAAVVVLAATPWTMRYGSETRMYLLVVVLVLLGAVALAAVHHGWWNVGKGYGGQDRGAVLALAAVSAALLYTHYWSLFLLTGLALVHLPGLRRREPPARRVLASLLLAGLAFLPWAPTFLFQAGHTGAPWFEPLGIAELLRTPRYFGGGTATWRTVFGVLVVLLVALALARRPSLRPAGAVVASTLGIAFALSYLGGGAYTDRYFAVVVPLVALLMAAGALTLDGTRVGTRVLGRRAAPAALGLLVAVGLFTGILSAGASRTSAQGLVDAYQVAAGPGQLLASCPDQLGPDVARLLGKGTPQLVYPTLSPPQRIDWVDYANRQASADPVAIARRLSEVAGDQPLFLQTISGYRTYSSDCERVRAELITLRGPSTLLFGFAGTETRQLHRFGPPR